VSAEVRDETTYFAYCPDCNSGPDEGFSFYVHAEQWVEQHDKDNHEGDE